MIRMLTPVQEIAVAIFVLDLRNVHTPSDFIARCNEEAQR